MRDLRSARGLATVFCVCAVATAGGSLTTAVAAGPGEVPGRGFLPDNRGYEKVSPDDKNDNDVMVTAAMSASESGNRIFYFLNGAPKGAPSGTVPSGLMSSREGSGWQDEILIPPVPQPNNQEAPTVLGVSRDLSAYVYRSFSPLTPGAPDHTLNFYLRREGNPFELITPLTVPGSGFSNVQATAGGTDDFSTVAYETTNPQTGAEAPGSALNAYVWRNGQVELVGVLPNGEPAPEGSRIGSGSGFGSTENAVSADGHRVFFHAIQEQPFSSSAGQLYVRQDEETIHVSASQRTDCAGDPTCGGDGIADPAPDPGGTFPALYLSAERGAGDKVLFSSCEKLTDDSTAYNSDDQAVSLQCSSGAPTGELLPLGRDLYRFDVETGQLADLTTADPTGADVFGVVGASDDLDRIYFVAGGVLAAGAPGHEPQSGAANLYLWDRGETKFIAALPAFPYFPNSAAQFDGMNWQISNVARGGSANVSPDGSSALITSRAPLTGYDNVHPSACPEVSSLQPPYNPEGRCAEVFLYRAEDDTIVCLSCSRDGAKAGGDAGLLPPFVGGNRGPVARNLSADGDRAYFNTPQALVDGDSNGKDDVYQWEGSGSGGCQAASPSFVAGLGGCLDLISSGESNEPSAFVESTPSGGDVFFRTRSRLVATDKDELFDLYDARVDGGFPSPPAPPPACEGDACQPPPSPPTAPTPASASFSGPADPSPQAARDRTRRKHKHPRKHKRHRHHQVGAESGRNKEAVR